MSFPSSPLLYLEKKQNWHTKPLVRRIVFYCAVETKVSWHEQAARGGCSNGAKKK